MSIETLRILFAKDSGFFWIMEKYVGQQWEIHGPVWENSSLVADGAGSSCLHWDLCKALLSALGLQCPVSSQDPRGQRARWMKSCLCLTAPESLALGRSVQQKPRHTYYTETQEGKRKEACRCQRQWQKLNRQELSPGQVRRVSQSLRDSSLWGWERAFYKSNPTTVTQHTHWKIMLFLSRKLYTEHFFKKCFKNIL